MGKGRVLGRVPDAREVKNRAEADAELDHAGAEHGAAVQATSEARVDGTSCRGRRLVNEVSVFPTAERFCSPPHFTQSGRRRGIAPDARIPSILPGGTRFQASLRGGTLEVGKRTGCVIRSQVRTISRGKWPTSTSGNP